MYKNLLLDDLVVLSARLPFLLSLILAGAVYYGTQTWILDKWVPLYAKKSNMEEIILFNVIYFGGLLIKYLLPMIFIFGALLRLYWKARYRFMYPRSLKEKIKSMSFNDFLINVSTHLTAQGYHVELIDERHDAPFNCILHKNGHQFLLKCYHKKIFATVSLREVKDLYKQIEIQKAHSCFAVTSGVFNREARKFSLGKSILLLDIESLKTWR